MKYGIQMELGQRALGFGPHQYMYQDEILTFDFCSQGPRYTKPPKMVTNYKMAQNALFYPKSGHFGNCDPFQRSHISMTL